jgi:hypothetical protein
VAGNARTHRHQEDFYGGVGQKFEIVEEHDLEFVDLLAADRDFALQEGAIPVCQDGRPESYQECLVRLIPIGV